jgi:hypothetical protein
MIGRKLFLIGEEATTNVAVHLDRQEIYLTIL